MKGRTDKMHAIILLVLALLTAKSFAQAWQPWDVSILLPLPHNSVTLDETLKASSHGARGELLPVNALAQLPLLVASLEREKTYQEWIRVVGIRLDPCFREGLSASICHRQIRMVWQPEILSSESVRIKDAAVHSFYELTETDWTSLIQDYEKLRNVGASTDSQRLTIHPVIAAQGLSGPYWQALKRLLLKYCGSQNLTRITLMNLDFNETQWTFRGYNIAPSNSQSFVLHPIEIFSTARKGQIVSILNSDQLHFNMTISPFLQGDFALKLYDNSKEFAAQASREELERFIQKQIEFESPRLHNPGTVDCASCHIAMATLSWAKRNDPTLIGEGQDHVDGTLNTDQLRAFGYFRTKPIISGRVIKETREVLETLNAKQKPSPK